MKMFDYDMTEERKAYYDATGYTILNACPGSGKTTSIIHKLGKLTKEVPEKYGKHSGVLCLSFTNDVVDEIQADNIKQHGKRIEYPNTVQTIDGFITEYIILQFWNLLNFFENAPMIVNEESQLRSIYWRKQHETSKEVCVLNNHLAYKYPPEKFERTAKGAIFKNYGNSKCFDITEKDNPESEYAKNVLKYRLKKGFITSAEAAYYALKLLGKHTFIARIISKKFPYIIVDEAQDLSKDQFNIILKLKSAGCQNIEFVGDLNQSIYEWRDAYPQQIKDLKKYSEWKSLSFKENRRSVQHIIDIYRQLLGTEELCEICSYKVKDEEIPITIFRFKQNSENNVIKKFQDMCDDYFFDNYAVLARSNNFIETIKGGIKEKIWKSNVPVDLIKAKIEYNRGNTKKSIEIVIRTISNLEGNTNANKVAQEKIKDYKERVKAIDFLNHMPSFKNSVKDWDIETCKLIKKVYSTEVDFQLIENEKNQSEYLYNLLGAKRDTYKNLMTIHSAKGLTYEATLVFLTTNKNSINIDLFDKHEKMDETHKILYVACSRAKQYLALAVEDKVSISKIKSIFGEKKLEIIDIN